MLAPPFCISIGENKGSAAKRAHLVGKPLSFVLVTCSTVDGLTGSGLDRRFPPPGDDEQPDAPRREKEKVGDQHYDSIGCGEAHGSLQPAHHDEGEADQSHDVANRPSNSRCPHDGGGEQHHRETQHEVLIALCPPLQPPDGFNTGKACRLLRRWCARPAASVACLRATPSTADTTPASASATPAAMAPNNPTQLGVPCETLSAKNRTSSPARKSPTGRTPEMDSGPARAIREHGKRGLVVTRTLRVQEKQYNSDQYTDEQ